jgi:hypothetical protein
MANRQGLGAWYGYAPPLRILSEAECKVRGAPPGIRYADLIPAELTILANPVVYLTTSS